MDFEEIPPGFGPHASFTLKRLEEGDNVNRCSGSMCTSGSVEMESEFDNSDIPKMRSLRRRPWINQVRYEDSSEDESDHERMNENMAVRPCLPKGVIRGCAECTNCQKVIARWQPEDARRHHLEDAPVFYPNEEEFKDTLNYIASIRPIAEPYGICRIVPPLSWKPPCPLKETNLWQSAKFATRVQRVDKLQKRNSVKKMSKFNAHMRKKKKKCLRMEVECGPEGSDILGPSGAGTCDADSFGFEPGPELTLKAFQEYADDFKSQYFSKEKNVTNTRPSIEDVEGEYWRLVEKPTEEIEVLYGADIETGTFGSGFPKSSNQVTPACGERYMKSGWNLNNFPRLPGSLLSYESGDISGVLVPWLYVGMCFSSFCWHVEDHHFYSMNYMHWGEPKLWYGVSARDALKLEAVMRKHLPDLFEEQPDLLHKLVTQLSPSILKSEGVPVYRCVQNSGEFVLTFPRAYHSGFNCGFNCAEAVNVAPVDWLPHGQNAIELYCEQIRRTSISHDKLLLGASREAVRAHWELNLLKKNTPDNLRWKNVCGKDGILVKALKARVEMERVRRQFLCNIVQAVKMDSNFDATSERECSVCLFDLHLSAAGCHCSPDKYSCLNHAKQLCSCEWGVKFFLFRYSIEELNLLVLALEGKLSAIYRWARLDLGLALSSHVSKDIEQVPKHVSKLPIESAARSSETSSYELKGETDVKVISLNLNSNRDEISSLRQQRPSEAVPAMEDAHSSSTCHKSQPEKSECLLAFGLENSEVCQLCEEDTLYSESLSTDDSEAKKHSLVEDGNILLSDGEGEDSNNPREEPSKSILDIAIVNSFTNQSKSPEERNNNKDPLLSISISTTSEALMRKGDASCLPDEERHTNPYQPVCLKIEDQEQLGEVNGSDPPSCSFGSTNADFACSSRELFTKTNNDQMGMINFGNHFQHDDNHEKNELNHSVNNVKIITVSPSCNQNNLDRHFRQKGPRIAKAVRRINCNVEPLEYGVVHSGKLWCNSRAIFPRGYRSRVKYISVLDPAVMCYYVSEILEGRIGPLFMVSVEDDQTEVFAHVSSTRCWEMLRARVNQEISRQHKLGRHNLPPLQSPGSLDGLEMFGFTSPAIVQGIEAMDRNRACKEYWNSRPYSRFQVHAPRLPQSNNINDEKLQKMSEKPTKEHGYGLPAGSDTILQGLLKKANLEELRLLDTILSSDKKPITDLCMVSKLLHDEIQARP